jgi:hypothetical protein
MASGADALRRLADHLEEQEHLETELQKAKEAHGDKDPAKRAGESKTKDELTSIKAALREHRQKGRMANLTIASLGELIAGNEGQNASVGVDGPVKGSAGVKPAGSKDGE